MEGSPAINAGNPSYSPIMILTATKTGFSSAIASTSFENATGGWTAFGQQLKQHLTIIIG